MILADTNAWHRYVIRPRVPNPAFAALIEAGEIVCHPWIYGELALGGLRPSTLRDIARLDFVPVAAHEEVNGFIQRHRPRGIGWVDVNLLVSALQAGTGLLTLDEALGANAAEHGCAARVH